MPRDVILQSPVLHNCQLMSNQSDNKELCIYWDEIICLKLNNFFEREKSKIKELCGTLCNQWTCNQWIVKNFHLTTRKIYLLPTTNEDLSYRHRIPLLYTVGYKAYVHDIVGISLLVSCTEIINSTYTFKSDNLHH